MVKADVETNIVNGIHTILHEIKRAEVSSSPTVNESEVVKKLFHREVGSSAERWSFFDDILMKYLNCTGASDTKKGAFSHRLACTLVAICLSDYDDFVRFIFDIYAGSGDSLEPPQEGSTGRNNSCQTINLQQYSEVLKTILPRHIKESAFDEHVAAFSLFLSSHPLHLDHQQQSGGEDSQENEAATVLSSAPPLPPPTFSVPAASTAASSVVFPKAVAVQYHIKMHKQLLWPLKVAQEQVKMKFLGVNYWAGLQRKIASASPTTASCSQYLSSQAQDFSSLVATMSALFLSFSPSSPSSPSTHEHAAPSPTPPVTPDSSQSQEMEIVEGTPGIYTYRHQLGGVMAGVPGGVARTKYVSPQKVVHHHSPIDHILQETFTSTESRRFPFPRHFVSTIGRASLSDMRRELSQTANTMAGLKMLIIEDSEVQRKMMHRQLSDLESGEDTKTAPTSPASLVLDLPPVPRRRLSNAEKSLRAMEKAVGEEGDDGSAEIMPDQQWTVTEACNGEEAMQMIIDTKTSFDVIVVDENLQHSGGNMLGHEFVSILRGHSSVLPTTVIIGCSGDAHGCVSDFLEAGADAVWQKPMPPSEVIHAEICKYIVTRNKYS